MPWTPLQRTQFLTDCKTQRVEHWRHNSLDAQQVLYQFIQLPIRLINLFSYALEKSAEFRIVYYFPCTRVWLFKLFYLWWLTIIQTNLHILIKLNKRGDTYVSRVENKTHLVSHRTLIKYDVLIRFLTDPILHWTRLESKYKWSYTIWFKITHLFVLDLICLFIIKI